MKHQIEFQYKSFVFITRTKFHGVMYEMHGPKLNHYFLQKDLHWWIGSTLMSVLDELHCVSPYLSIIRRQYQHHRHYFQIFSKKRLESITYNTVNMHPGTLFFGAFKIPFSLNQGINCLFMQYIWLQILVYPFAPLQQKTLFIQKSNFCHGNVNSL